MTIIKIFNIPSKLPKCNLPSNILKHCCQYKNIYARKSSIFAWMCLSKYINLGKVTFKKDGKPILNIKNKYFSLSHSYNKIAIAINDKPIGIDIEKKITISMASSIAPKILRGSDLSKYKESKDQCLWLTKYWTKCEAYYKTFGKSFTFKKTNLNTLTNFKIRNVKINNEHFVCTYIEQTK